MTRIKTIVYKEIDLTKGNKHEHPDIKKRKRYLAKIDGEMYHGKFEREWYGWRFDDGWGTFGHQFDTPGWNSSDWQELWEESSNKVSQESK